MTPRLLRVQLDHTFLSSKKSPSSADVEIPVQGSKAMKGPLLLVDQRTRFSKSAKSNSKPLPDFFRDKLHRFRGLTDLKIMASFQIVHVAKVGYAYDRKMASAAGDRPIQFL